MEDPDFLIHVHVYERWDYKVKHRALGWNCLSENDVFPVEHTMETQQYDNHWINEVNMLQVSRMQHKIIICNAVMHG